MPPPATGVLSDGTEVDLHVLAVAVTEVHLQRHPEDSERYGALAWEWCVHDTQHLLAWAIGDLDFVGQLRWLSSLLHARGYPVANLYDCVLTCARVLRARCGALGEEPARRMEDAVAGVDPPAAPAAG